jgi:hypothetical protein
MKIEPTSRTAPARRSLGEGGFFNSRLLIVFALCSAGLLLAWAGLSKSVTGSTPDILNGHCGVNNNNQLTGYCVGGTGGPDLFPEMRVSRLRSDGMSGGGNSGVARDVYMLLGQFCL